MENQINAGVQNTQQIGQNPINQPVLTPEKPRTNYLVIGVVILVCFVVFGLGGYYLEKQSTVLLQDLGRKQNRPTLSPVTPDGEKIIASEVTLEGCKIKVTTNKREIFLNTSFLESNPQTKCYQFVLNPISPSGKYVAFQDISGGLDSQIRIYSLDHNKDISLDVLGSSTIKYVDFLPDDRLAVINGYFGYFGKEWLGQWLRIYDTPNLFNKYPDNVDQQYNYFKLSDDSLVVVDLPDKGVDYTSFSVDGKTIKLFGPDNSASAIHSVNLDTLSPNVGYRNVQLFYYNKTLDPKFDCMSEAVLPVNRQIPITKTPIQDTIKLLIEGKLTEKEKTEGFGSEFPHPEFKLLGATLKDGILTLDFPEVSSFTSGGSCRVGLLRAEVEKTAKQFPEVKEVRYTKLGMFQP